MRRSRSDHTNRTGQIPAAVGDLTPAAGDGGSKPAGTAEPITAEPPDRLRLAPLGVAFSDVAFLHWAYEPDRVRPLLPPGTRPDVFDGAAYVGIVAFRMRSYGEFHEFNVRTYSVDERGRRGVLFLSMEADRLPWVLGARAVALPYRWSQLAIARNGHELDYRCRRRWPGPRGLGCRIRLRVGSPVDGTPLDHFLTARWRMHHRMPGVTLSARLSHERWPLHAADVLELHENLIAATGLPEPEGPPVSVRYAPRVDGRLSLPRPVTWPRAAGGTG